MTPDAAVLRSTTPHSGIATFGGDAVIGTLGGLIGLGGAEFRLPILIGFFRFMALRAVLLNQEQKGMPTVLIFGAAALFVFLVLAAKYESWKVPLAVVLIVPMCLLASISGLMFRGMSIDILA